MTTGPRQEADPLGTWSDPLDAGYATPSLPGVGGTIKQRHEDFLVEELPLYDPVGEGEHVYVLLEKRGMSSQEMVRVVAQHFGVREDDVGYAGMKDKHAVTRQVVSVHVPGKKPEDFPELRHDKVGVLWADLHTNKLRLGHLRGNRFSIKVRGVEGLAAVRAKRVVDELVRVGVPNLFGPQRFGYLNLNHELGRLLLLNDFRGLVDLLLGPTAEDPATRETPASEQNRAARAKYAEGDLDAAYQLLSAGLVTERAVLGRLVKGQDPEEAVRRVHPLQLKFWLSAFQSAVFNGLTASRLNAGALGAFELGDVAIKLRNGALFDVDEETLGDPDLERRRAAFDVAPSGPIWGARMKTAQHCVARREHDALRATGVTVDAIDGVGDELNVRVGGTRRAMVVPIGFPEVEGGTDEHGHYVRVAFELPSGSFATVVMREIMKNRAPDVAAPGPADQEDPA